MKFLKRLPYLRKYLQMKHRIVILPINFYTALLLLDSKWKISEYDLSKVNNGLNVAFTSKLHGSFACQSCFCSKNEIIYF